MRTTIKDIAKETNLSLTTVSLVLNNKPHRLSKETCERVLATAKKLNYRPNRMAASLVTNSTRIIGMIINDISNTYYAELAKGAEARCREEGYALIICNAGSKKDNEQYINLLIEQSVDGVISAFWPDVAENDVAQIISQADQASIKLVLIDFPRNIPNISYISLDNRQGAYLATRHLINLNHRRIGFIADPFYMKTLSASQRFLGYQNALLEADINFDDSLVVPGKYTIESGYHCTKALIAKEVTAIFAANDLMAYGSYQYAREKDIIIPDQLSVVGFDDIIYSDFFSPQLTTVRQPTFQMGYQAANELIESLKNKTELKSSIIFAPELIIRKSTSALTV